MGQASIVDVYRFRCDCGPQIDQGSLASQGNGLIRRAESDGYGGTVLTDNRNELDIRRTIFPLGRMCAPKLDRDPREIGAIWFRNEFVEGLEGLCIERPFTYCLHRILRTNVAEAAILPSRIDSAYARSPESPSGGRRLGQ